MESNPADLARRAISIDRTRRTVIEATTSPRASFSFTLFRTTARGASGMFFLLSPRVPSIVSLRFATSEPRHEQPRRARRPHPDRAALSPVRHREVRLLLCDARLHDQGRPALPRQAARRLGGVRDRLRAGDHRRVEDPLGCDRARPVDDPGHPDILQSRSRPGPDGPLHEERRDHRRNPAARRLRARRVQPRAVALGGPRYGSILSSRAVWRQDARSLAKNASIWSGALVPSVKIPSARRRCSISGSRSRLFISRFSLWIAPPGVPAGATIANQSLNSNPGKVSDRVGTSFSPGSRRAELTAIARSCPLFTAAAIAAIPWMVRCVRPEMVSPTPCPLR